MVCGENKYFLFAHPELIAKQFYWAALSFHVLENRDSSFDPPFRPLFFQIKAPQMPLAFPYKERCSNPLIIVITHFGTFPSFNTLFFHPPHLLPPLAPSLPTSVCSKILSLLPLQHH